MKRNLNRRQLLMEAGKAAAGAAMWHAAGPYAFGQQPTQLKVQRLSWAGVKIETGQSTLFVDPWVSAEIWDGAWKAPVIPIEVKTASRLALVTHAHNDHMDPAALKQIFPTFRGAAFCHEDIVGSIAAFGVPVRAMKLHQAKAIGDWVIAAVPAVDGLGEQQVSWVISTQGYRFIHCGDTLWHGYFNHIGQAFGPFDIAFLPINGPILPRIQPSVQARRVLTPAEAVEAAIALRAKTIVPIHYGISVPGTYEEYPNVEGALREAAAKRQVSHSILKPGEELALAAK